MPWHDLGLPPAEAEMLHREAAGVELAVCRHAGEIYALHNECPHAGGPLAMGNFSPPLIACPWHAWEFDCRTGECVHSDRARVARFPVELRDGRLFVNLPE